MMHILLINGAKKFAHSNGELNNTLSQIAVEQLTTMGHQIQVTHANDDYEISDEVDKFLWADSIIYQMPAWWMSTPWIIKKYIDEVFTAGHGKLYANDGRSRSDASQKYGSGGLLMGKHYMLSLTWNAPMQAFTESEQFFHGVGVDGVYLPFHKANQFLGLSPLPTFIANDVIKQPNIERDIATYRLHLNRVFSI